MDESNFTFKELFISPTDSLLIALEIIDKAGDGATKLALVVDADLRLIGILNDGDIRRALLSNASLSEPVSRYMTKNFKYLKEYSSRTTAIEMMENFSISQVPVVDKEKRVLGIHFIKDFLVRKPLNNIAVIMSGGKGTRLRPITENIPKPMIRVAGKPILEHIINHLVGHKIKKIFISVGYKAEIIQNYFKDGQKHGCSIEYLKEEIPLGTAGALSLLSETDNDLILMNGDIITQFNIQTMLSLHKRRRNMLTIGAKDHVETISYGVLETSDYKVVNVIEKPEKHYLVNGGIYILHPEILNYIPKNKIYFATDLINDCLINKKEVGYFLLENDWVDVGEPDQLKRAQGL